MLARSGGVAAFTLALALAGVAHAARPAEDADASLELRAKSAWLARRFDRAVVALGAEDYVEASEGFAAVLAHVPGFVPALRHRCKAERELGHFQTAVSLCRAAVERAPSADALVGLSYALSLRGRYADLEEARALADRALALEPMHPGALLQRVQVAVLERDLPGAEALLARAQSALDATKAARAHALLAHLGLDAGEPSRAMRHAERAVHLDPHGYEGWVVFARAAFDLDDAEALRRAAPAMLELAPDGAYTQYVAGVVDVMDGNFARARAHAKRARWLGMEPESCDRLLATILRKQPLLEGVRRPTVFALGAGALLLIALWGLGALLGRLTLRRLELRGPDVTRFDSRGGRLLRRSYRRVLLACGAYYYVLLPLMGLFVAGSVAAALRLFLASGQLPIGIAVVLLLLGGLLLFAVIEAAFLRPRERRNDEPLDLEANPGLARALAEVAQAIGTRPVTRVYVTPGAELAIVEEGGLGRLLLGRSERCMRLGVGMLSGLEIGELKALLAREYGHVRSTGTAGGGFALAFDRSLSLVEDALGESGVASFVNPAWLFLRGFRRAFRDVSRGARRLQELCADQWAAEAYGVDALARGLRHVIAARARLEAHTHATLDEVVSTQRGLTNLYTYRTSNPPDERCIEAAIERAWHRTPGDAWSSPALRVARVSSIELPAATRPRGDDARPAWALFASREALEMSMTDALRNDLARKGITVEDEGELEAVLESRPAVMAE